MRTLPILIFLCVMTSLFFSCANNEYMEHDICESSIHTTDIISSRAEEENMIPDIDTNTYANMPNFLAASYNPSGINFFYLKDVPFTIKNRQCNKYLSAQGKEKEVKLSSSVTSNKEHFTVLYNGVYKIYSVAYKVPITRGHKEGSADTKRLILPNTDDPEYASKWYVNPAQAQGHFIINNTSYMEPTPNGIVYYGLKVENSTDIRYGIYAGDPTQEFEFTPLVSFNLKSVTYRPQYTRIRKLTPKTITAAQTNTKNIPVAYTFELEEEVTEQSRFTEDRYINFQISNLKSIRFQRPNVINGEVDIIPDQSSPADAYYQSEIQNIRKTIRATYPINIPARTKLIVNYTWNVYELEAEYEAKITYNGQEFTLVGIWKGTAYIDDIPYEEQNWEVIDLNTGSSRKVNMSEITNSTL